MREIKPAQNYDVVSFAKAMNDDFGKKAQKLFAPETEAALEAQRTGNDVMFYLIYLFYHPDINAKGRVKWFIKGLAIGCLASG
jgi:hypothetical protein